MLKKIARLFVMAAVLKRFSRVRGRWSPPWPSGGSESAGVAAAGFSAAESVVTSMTGSAAEGHPAVGVQSRQRADTRWRFRGAPPRRLLDPSQRPAQSPQGYNLLFLILVQDIGHTAESYQAPGLSQCPG